MIYRPLSPGNQQPFLAITPSSSLPVEPPPAAVGNEPLQAPSAPQTPRVPRLRRATLENAPARDTSKPSALTLSQRQELAGNIHTNYCLTVALEEIQAAITEDPSLDVAALLEVKKFSAHHVSTFGRAYKIAPGEDVPLAWFLRENQWRVPKDLGQLANLIAVCKEPLPEPVEHGNYWGLLSQPATLDSGQRTRLSEMAAAEMATLSPGKGIFTAFFEKHGASLQGMSAAQLLESMLGSAQIRNLGQTLEMALNSDASLTSKDASWALAAMVLELDPRAGSKRGVVAGYDLYQPANRDVHPSVVVSRLEKHLVDQGKVPVELAPAAARLLLAGADPAFIAEDMPSNLVVKSAAFAKLSAVVQAQEFWTPGIATYTDFQTFMRLANHSPVSEAEGVVEAKAQSNALIQWGVAQDEMAGKDDEDYTSQDVVGLRDAFNEELSSLKKAHEQISAAMPTRENIAVENLKEAYGADHSFDVRNISIANIDASESQYHSLLDIYMSGKMDRIPRGQRYDFQLGNRFTRVKPLPDVNQAFDSQFDSYFNNLKEGVTTTSRHQLLQLSAQDRHTIASGKVEFFSLRKAGVAQAEETESPEQAQAAKARYGLLMRVLTKVDKNGSDRDVKNLRHVYYEVFPLQGVIRRRDDLPRYLPNPPPRVANAQTYATTQAKGVSVPVDYEAYENGTPPQAGKVSTGLLTQQLNAPYLPEPRQGQDASSAVSVNARFDTIAKVIADHLLHDRDAIKAGAKGVTEVEKEEAGIKAAHDFVTGLIPFKNAIENAVKGNTGAAIKDFALDIFGFILPFGKGLGQASKALGKLSEKLGTRAFKVSDTVLRSVASGLNPTDGLGDLAVGLARGGKTVLKSSFGELKQILQEQSVNVGVSGKVANTVSDIAGTGRQLPDYSAHSLPDSLLEGRNIKGDGTYQVGDQHYVRFTDGTATSRVFEISRNYKVAGGQVRVIDPVTQKTVMFLQPTGTGEWRLNSLLGGVKPETLQRMNGIRPAPQKRPAGQGSSGSAAGVGGAGSQPAFKRPKLPEVFQGEKALMDPPVKGENRFYHYTGAKSHAAINSDWHLQSSVLNVDGKPLPRGKGRHYFTDLAPDDAATKEISTTIFGRRRHGNQLDKMTHYYEVNTSGLAVMKTDNPHIFYVETTYALPLKYSVEGEPVSRIITHGQTPFTA
ncbi:MULTISPECIES: hypothetical protein [unclassified Pseudomonas]|uniref:hypothetical protein n=1 Tax=unclassified Pseudomonas TaxID=196821 RepID=UPI001CEC8954|nr:MULTISPECIES: hypothetical protein [unclassified Pseudomonas]